MGFYFMPYGFIYLTTNLINGKKYIGARKYTKDWKYYLGSGVELKKDIKKFGRENFERKILEDVRDENEMKERELYWIKYYDAVNSDEFYNKVYRSHNVELQIKNGGGGHNANSRTICCHNLKTDEVEEFENITQFSERRGIARVRIYDCLRGNRDHTEHYTFYYKDSPLSPEKIQKIKDKVFAVFVCENINTGEKREFTNQRHFAHQNGFTNTCISKCISGHQQSHKGHKFYRKTQS